MIIKRIIIKYEGNFGEFIKRIRLNLGYTQDEFSEIMSRKYNGFSYSSIRNYEQGKREPKYELDVLECIEDVFREELIDKCIQIEYIVGDKNGV